MEEKIRDAISWSIILVPIMFGLFAVANAYFYYTMDNASLYVESTGPGMTINQVPGGYVVSAINDTKSSNLTTVVDRQFIDEKINSLVVEFNYTTGQQQLGIDYFQCAIDYKEYGECSSPFVLPLKDYNDNKTHTLEIRAIDMKGNAEQTPVAIFFPINMTTIK